MPKFYLPLESPLNANIDGLTPQKKVSALIKTAGRFTLGWLINAQSVRQQFIVVDWMAKNTTGELKRRKELEKVDKFKGFHKFNCVRINSNNTIEHEMAKFRKAFELAKEGHTIATEVSLTDGRIVDLVDFTDGEFYEFETGKSYEKTENFITVVNV